MADRSTICLVDGSGYIFRAFYALPPMTRSDGTPVNAVYGFMNMLMNLSQDNMCSHIVVIFDAKRQNFRNTIYPAYKENRKEVPEDLIPQFSLIRKATETLNIPWIELEGYEADDLIATYAQKAVSKGWSARVISADKDLMQLKAEHVSVYDPMKKKLITDQDVLNKFGVSSDKIIDVQALMGDKIDNVPGAAGIGPKTAAQLINQFGNLENLLNHLDEIPQQKRREGLKRDKEQIIISKKLVTLDKNVPIEIPIEEFQVKSPNPEIIHQFLKENGFNSLLKRVQNWSIKRTETVSHYQIPHEETISEDHTQQSPQKDPLLAQEVPPQTKQTWKKEYTLITTEQALKNWLSKVTDKISIDTETTGLEVSDARLVGFSLGLGNGVACYIPVDISSQNSTDSMDDLFNISNPSSSHQKQEVLSCKTALSYIKPILENHSILKIGHNIKYDMHILSKEMMLSNLSQNLKMEPIEDTMVMSSVLDGSQHGHSLDELAEICLNYTTIKYTDVCGTGRNKILFSEVPLDQACLYAAEDADVTFQLYDILSQRIKTEDSKSIYHTIDLPLIPILFQMERAGVLIDQAHLLQLGKQFTNQLSQLTQRIYQIAGEEFNINSPAQLGVILFEKQNLSGGKKNANGSWATDVKVLESLSEKGSDLAKLVLEYRSFSKLKSTYVDALLKRSCKDPRIHTSFSLTSTNTGRLASSDPNLQNIPIRSEEGKEIRRSFISRAGYKLIAADYSQIELRLLAEVANVSLLKESFIHNEDIHARTASEIFHIPLEEIDADTRRRAKAINFGIVYGISAFGLSNNLGISRHDAKEYIDTYFEKYPEIQTYMKETEEFALKNKYVLTPFGRKCFIQGLDSGRTKSFALRAAINAPIQGGAADIVKMAMNLIDKKLKQSSLDCTLLLQVHDELVFEVAEKDTQESINLIKSAMENVVSLSIPLIADVGIGNNWKESH